MKRKITLTLLCLIILAAFAALHYVPSAKAAAQIQLLSHRGFYTPAPVGAYGTYNVVGEVKNVGDAPANKINITVVFRYSPGGPIIDSEFAATFIDCVLPNTKAPFRAGYAGTASVPANLVGNFTVSLNGWNDSQAKPQKLQILNSTYYTEYSASIQDSLTQTTGIVKNIETTSTNATNTQLTIIYHYNTNGSIYWATRGTTSPDKIVPESKSSFKISTYPAHIPHELVNATLVAESREYLSPPFLNPILDTIKPTIGTPVWFPSSPTPQQIVAVNVTVTKPDYASKVTRVFLYYRALGDQSFKTLNMTASGGLWRTPVAPSMGPFGGGQTINFYIEAYDERGNKQTSPFYQFSVQGQATGVPLETLILAFIALIIVVVVYRYRKRLF